MEKGHTPYVPPSKFPYLPPPRGKCHGPDHATPRNHFTYAPDAGPDTVPTSCRLNLRVWDSMATELCPVQ